MRPPRTDNATPRADGKEDEDEDEEGTDEAMDTNAVGLSVAFRIDEEGVGWSLCDILVGVEVPELGGGTGRVMWMALTILRDGEGGRERGVGGGVAGGG